MNESEVWGVIMTIINNNGNKNVIQIDAPFVAPFFFPLSIFAVVAVKTDVPRQKKSETQMFFRKQAKTSGKMRN